MARDRHKIKFQISNTVAVSSEAIAQYQDIPVQTVQCNAWRIGLIWVAIDSFIGEPIEAIDLDGCEVSTISITVPEGQYQKVLEMSGNLNLNPSEIHQVCIFRGIELLRRITAFEEKISKLS